MSDINIILNEIKGMKDTLSSHDTKLGQITEILTSISVQNSQIHDINKQLDALWKTNDLYFGAKGVIHGITSHQAKCPKESMEKEIGRLWKGIWSLSTIFIATLVVMALIFQDTKEIAVIVERLQAVHQAAGDLTLR